MKLEVRNLYKSFGPKEVLKGISFTAESGKALGLLGRNGAGKTTAIRIIMGVLPAGSGEVLLDGKNWISTALRSAICRRNAACTPKTDLGAACLFWPAARDDGLRGQKSAQALVERLGMQEYMNKSAS